MREVAIVGAGPAGLVLARLLQRCGDRVTVYERDPARGARDQGGTLDLHPETGQRAIEAAGLRTRFAAAARPEGQSTKILDSRGVVAMQTNPEDEPEVQPEIDRGALREILLDSLEPGTVRWDSQLERVDAGGALWFRGARTPVTADLVAGCDGAWSKVRAARTRIAPRYSGVTFVETRIRQPSAAIAALVGEGSALCLGKDRGLLAQRNGDGHIRVYVALRDPEDWTATCGIPFHDAPAAKRALAALFAEWAPALLELIEAGETFSPRPLFTVPPEQTWEPSQTITLLGDAAHVMPPFTGRGANYAMLDAVELDAALAAHADVAPAIAAYEAEMLARMSDAIRATLAAQDAVLAPDAPASLLAQIGE